jgi:hypothetical protein
MLDKDVLSPHYRWIASPHILISIKEKETIVIRALKNIYFFLVA